jgi:exodeoxyribonuclease VII large subunit
MEQRLTLAALQMMIRDSIVLAMPGSYWITAEIAELKVNYSGHCYLELIEKNPTGENIKARARATIWAGRYRSVKPLFESATGESLREGLRVLIKVSVEYHELYGMSLNITDIDPTYTVGEMAMKRNEILRRLTEEGIIEMNAGLDFPLLPVRIAVISSASAAGYTDFVKQLIGNSRGYRFYTELYNSPMQGEETEKGIIAALDLIASRSARFDVVAILRGGGSTADLRWFDSYPLAFHITQFPLPVITGIGHDKDVSVADIVAWQSFKTPTAVAAFLVEKMYETEIMVTEFSDRLNQAAKNILMENRSLIGGYARRIHPATSTLIGTTRQSINRAALSLSSATGNLIRKTGTDIAIMHSSVRAGSNRLLEHTRGDLTTRLNRLESAARSTVRRVSEETERSERLISMADPVNILKKGFSMTRRDGKTIRSTKELHPGDVIVTQFCDGKISSEVKTLKTNTKENG